MKLETCQKIHFDKENSRYDVNKIFSSPTHTKLEINQLISLIPNCAQKVVDFGSGNGRLTIPLLEKNYSVTAVDISNKSLMQLQKIAKKHSNELKIENSLRKITNADAIVGCDVLHHVDLNIELINISNCLNKDGIIVFSEPNFLNISWIIYFLLKRIWKYEKGVVNFSYYNLKKILKRNGFRSIRIIGLGLLPRRFFQYEKWCRLNDFVGNLPIVKLFAYRYLITAHKG